MQNQAKLVRRYGVRILLVVAGSVLALVLSEIALRFLGDRFSISYFPAFDDSTGWTGAPNSEGLDWESRQIVRFNSEGLHDREHSKQKPPNTLRIAVLGDSMTEAAGVPTNKTFCSVLERSLAVCPSAKPRTVEVINFGIDAYSTAQEFLTLNRVWDYAPDVVVLAFFSGNDVCENSPALDFNRISTGLRPYFRYQDGRLVLRYYGSVKYPLFSRTYFWVRRHSRVLEVVRRVYFGTIRSRATLSPASESGGLPAKVYWPPTDPVWQEAWLVTEKLVVATRDAVMARGAKFVVVTLGTPIQDYPDPSERERFMNKLGLPNLFYPDLRLRALGQREGIKVFNLAATLQQYAEEHKVFLHGFPANESRGQGHWNEEGHRVAGQLIARDICEETFASAASNTEQHETSTEHPPAESKLVRRKL
jgi:hypothetical protein